MDTPEDTLNVFRSSLESKNSFSTQRTMVTHVTASVKVSALDPLINLENFITLDFVKNFYHVHALNSDVKLKTGLIIY